MVNVEHYLRGKPSQILDEYNRGGFGNEHPQRTEVFVRIFIFSMGHALLIRRTNEAGKYYWTAPSYNFSGEEEPNTDQPPLQQRVLAALEEEQLPSALIDSLQFMEFTHSMPMTRDIRKMEQKVFEFSIVLTAGTSLLDLGIVPVGQDAPADARLRWVERGSDMLSYIELEDIAQTEQIDLEAAYRRLKTCTKYEVLKNTTPQELDEAGPKMLLPILEARSRAQGEGMPGFGWISCETEHKDPSEAARTIILFPDDMMKVSGSWRDSVKSGGKEYNVLGKWEFRRLMWQEELKAWALSLELTGRLKVKWATLDKEDDGKGDAATNAVKVDDDPTTPKKKNTPKKQGSSGKKDTPRRRSAAMIKGGTNYP